MGSIRDETGGGRQEEADNEVRISDVLLSFGCGSYEIAIPS